MKKICIELKREDLKSEYINTEWVDFTSKIIYLYENLFDNNKEMLIKYFSDKTSMQKYNSRKKTIENWLEGKTKKPNSFHIENFKINEYTLNSEPLFYVTDFQKGSLTAFKKRIDLYLSQKQNFDVPNQMKYIYFFNAMEKKLSYFEINYTNPENNAIIQLTSPIYTPSANYYGILETHNSMIYISVKSNFDRLNYIFKNNVEYYKKELKVFGVAQSVDAPTREPKMNLALLTSSKLTTEEERKFAHKLNFSNLIIADDFETSSVLELNYFLENFSDKIYELNKDITHYGINEIFSKDMYYDIILQEYHSYIKLLEKSLYHDDYPINHRRQSILFALEEMCEHKVATATILYLINPESINILDSKNSIMEMQLKLVKEGKLTLNYLFIIDDISIISQNTIERINFLEAHGVNVKLSCKSQNIYSRILVVKEKNFALYKRVDEQEHNHVTKNASTIQALNYLVDEVSKNAINLETFLKTQYPLNGKWYHYTLNYKIGREVSQRAEIDIKNNYFQAKSPKRTSEGQLLKRVEYTLLLGEHSILKIHNIYLKEDIFRVSIIGEEHKMHNKDVLLYGLMSRNEIQHEKIMYLLKSINKQNEQNFRLQVSNDFDSLLAEFEDEYDELLT